VCPNVDADRTRIIKININVSTLLNVLNEENNKGRVVVVGGGMIESVVNQNEDHHIVVVSRENVISV